MVHKSGHHFDLVNWWLDAQPVEVAGFGKLAFYGEEAGKKHGWAKDYVRAKGNEEAKKDPFALLLEEDEILISLKVVDFDVSEVGMNAETEVGWKGIWCGCPGE